MILVRLFLLISINILCASSVFAACDLNVNLPLSQRITSADTVKRISGTISVTCNNRNGGGFFVRVEDTITSDNRIVTGINNVTVKYTVDNTEINNNYSKYFESGQVFNFTVEINQTSSNRGYGNLALPKLHFWKRESFPNRSPNYVDTATVHVFPTTLNIVNYRRSV